VARPHERKFLGFSFTDGSPVLRAIAPLTVVRFNPTSNVSRRV
jgi:hypothetical protein